MSFLRFLLCVGFLWSTTVAAAPGPGGELTAVMTRQIALLPAAERDALTRLYQPPGYAPLWLGRPEGLQALAALRQAEDEGLDPARYQAPILASAEPRAPTAQMVEYDLTLTRRLLSYAQDLHQGATVPQLADKMVWIDRPGFDAAGTLANALASGHFGAWIDNLAPDYSAYRGLRIALKHYRTVALAGGWPAVPPARKIALTPGNELTIALAARLRAEDASLTSDDAPSLQAAVQRFQLRSGLPADGKAGAKTIATLNISARARADTIKANMERWRWLPHAFPERYVAVNAADATLVAVAGGKVTLTSRVMAGKPHTQTAIFNAQAEAVTVNPPWEVPASIVRTEILPKLRRDPGYLVSNHLVMEGARVRQLPGPDNALGRIKVEMPNRFTAYLHDTNAPRLFARDERHLSHGCVRVEQIVPLASWLLMGDVMAGRTRIEAALADGKTERIALDNPVPVFVLYWTALPRPDGTAEFRPDIYGRDERLIRALAGQTKGSAAWNKNSRGCSLPT